MCKNCVQTGRMTIAEMDQMEAAERQNDLATILRIVGDIRQREADASSLAVLTPEQAETAKLDASLDSLLSTLLASAAELDDLPLSKANMTLASELESAGARQLAYGLASLVIRIQRGPR